MRCKPLLALAAWHFVERLIDAGAHVDAGSAPVGGRIALQAAARWAKLEVVERLLHAGADIDAQPALTNAETVAEAANWAGDFAVAHMIAKVGASASRNK